MSSAAAVSAVARRIASAGAPRTWSTGSRAMGTKAREAPNPEPIPPNHTIDSVRPP